jgi:acetate kinase
MKNILVINAGSSSLKFKLFDESLQETGSGIVERIGLSGAFIASKFDGAEKKVDISAKNHKDAMSAVVHALAENGVDFESIKKVGHRVVHGGEQFVQPTKVSTQMLKDLREFNRLAPLHNPNNIAGIEACQRILPHAENWAVFDTAFHSTIPDYAYLYPLPYSFYEKRAIRRYGFHGISHMYVSEQATKKLRKKKANLITCHLGSGCSICAIKSGRSVDTSMGFTPLEGLMMSTRCGDIDPSIVSYLLNDGMKLSEVDELLNFRSGLKGVSGLKDMRDIMVASGYKVPGYKPSQKFDDEDKRLAKLALKMFFYRIVKYIGAYSAVLGDVDAIVFTAGIGERNKDIRNLIMRALNYKYKMLVIPTNEELMIARQIS